MADPFESEFAEQLRALDRAALKRLQAILQDEAADERARLMRDLLRVSLSGPSSRCPTGPRLAKLPFASPHRGRWKGESVAKPDIQQVSRAGEHFVAAELHRRGAYAVTFAGNMPRIDILATNTEQTRTAAIQVKTMTARTWQTSITRRRPREEPAEEDTHWIFVELKKPPAQPDFYIVPEWWVEKDIFRAHGGYLAKHGGQRARTKESTRHCCVG